MKHIIFFLFIFLQGCYAKQEVLEVNYDNRSVEILSEDYYIDSISVHCLQGGQLIVSLKRNMTGLRKIKIDEIYTQYSILENSLRDKGDHQHCYVNIFARRLDGEKRQAFEFEFTSINKGMELIRAEGEPFP